MRTLFATVIGVFSCLFGIGLSVECVVRFMLLDKDDVSYELNGISLLVTLILASIMAILSALMVYGVRKRYSCLITPWLVLEILGTICGIINFLLSNFKESSGSTIFWRVCFVVTGLLIWFPVFTLWRDMRESKKSSSSSSSASNHQSPPYECTVVNYSGQENENVNMPQPEVV